MRTFQAFPGVRMTSDLCIWMESEATIAIADLHIGLEGVLEAEGMHLPRIQTESMRDSLMRIVDRYQPERVLILGDLKHEFSHNLGQELAEVRQVVRQLRDGAEVWVAKGNHDNFLASLAKQLDLRVETTFRLGGVSMMHGHMDSEERPLVIGHEHPSVRLFDSIGAYLKLPCFLHFEKERVLVLPAFSPLAPGMDFTNATKGRALSPVLRDADVGAAQVYACSEIGLMHLGPVSGLKRVSR